MSVLSRMLAVERIREQMIEKAADCGKISDSKKVESKY